MTKSKDLLNQAVQTAQAVGLPVKSTPPRSDDPFYGYSTEDLVEVVGAEDVREIADLYVQERLEELKDKPIELGSCVVGLRGKTKGLKGWVNREMPSQYNENEMAYLVVSVDPTQGSGWVKAKSLKLRVPDTGERDLVEVSKKKYEVAKAWGRGAVVLDQAGRRGVLVGFGKDDQPLPQVCVQWADTGAEEWQIATPLQKG
jgi:hypothetical protein